MIPTTGSGSILPPTSGNPLFHVIIDNFNRTFSMDGPGGPNGIRLHHEMMRISREQKKVRELDLEVNPRKLHWLK